MTAAFTLGQRVTWAVADEMHRINVTGDWYRREPWRKRWQRTQYDERHREGVVVGLRTLSNGINESHGDEGIQYIPEEYIPAVLVAYDLRRKPVYVEPRLLREV